LRLKEAENKETEFRNSRKFRFDSLTTELVFLVGKASQVARESFRLAGIRCCQIMKKILYCCVTVLLTVFAVASVSAQVVYNSRTTYDLAHPINYVIDFNNFGPDGTFYPSGLTASTPFGNVIFNGIPQTSTAIEALSATHFGFAAPANNNNFVLNDNTGQFDANSLLITLPANSFSFGTDIISPSALVAEPYTFTIFSGSTVLDVIGSSSASGMYTFIGFDSLTSAITSIEVQITGGIGASNPVLDNFTIVPEPATWSAGIGAATLLLLAGRRFRVKRA
jgi:hypothetical protein